MTNTVTKRVCNVSIEHSWNVNKQEMCNLHASVAVLCLASN